MSFTTPVDGQAAVAEHIAQITETLKGNRAIPITLTNTLTTGHLLPGSTLTYNIGAPGSLVGSIYTNSVLLGTNITPPALKAISSTGSAALESSAAYALVQGKTGALLGGNAYYNGTNWNRFDVAKPATQVGAQGDGLMTFLAAPAGANPISNFAEVARISSTGLHVGYKGTVGAAVGTFDGRTDGSGDFGLQVRNASVNRNNFLVRDDGVCFVYSDLSVGGAMTIGAGGAGVGFQSNAGAFQINANDFVMYGDAGITRIGTAHLLIGDYSGQWGRLGIHGNNVESNGVLLSVHGNYYGGIYYSTTGQFLAWPSEGRLKARQAALPDPLRLMDRAAISYRQPSVAWADGEAMVIPDEAGAAQWGFRAEDWRDHPELVQPGPAGIDSFNLTGMIPLTWEAVRALYAELVTLRLRVDELENAA